MEIDKVETMEMDKHEKVITHLLMDVEVQCCLDDEDGKV